MEYLAIYGDDTLKLPQSAEGLTTPRWSRAQTPAPLSYCLGMEEVSVARPYEVLSGACGGVARLPIDGPIWFAMNPSSVRWGGVSSAALIEAIKEADRDSEIDEILLDLNSPGGSSSAHESLATAVRNCTKPVRALINTMACSLAVGLYAHADEVVMVETALTGSIGSMVVLDDYTEMDKKLGLRVVPVATGRFKAMDASSEVTEEKVAYHLSVLEKFYASFAADVTAGRGLSREQINGLEGRVLYSDEALSLGLVDRVVNADEYVGALLDGAESNKTAKPSKKGSVMSTMTVEELKAKYPEQANALIEEGKNEAKAEMDEEDPKSQEEEEDPKSEEEEEPKAADDEEDPKSEDDEKPASLAQLERIVPKSLVNRDTLIVTAQRGRMSLSAATGLVNQTLADQNAALEKKVSNLTNLGGAGAGSDPVSTKTGDGVEDFDQAVAMIQKRDNCSKMAAISRAGKEFPQLHLDMREKARSDTKRTRLKMA